MAQRMALLTGAERWLPVAAAAACAAVLTALLILGIRRADSLQSASGALQLATELAARPQIIGSELTIIQRELEARTFAAQSLRRVAALRTSSQSAFARMRAAIAHAGTPDAAIRMELRAAAVSWGHLDAALQPIAAIRSDDGLYSETASGSRLSPGGRQLLQRVDALLANPRLVQTSAANLGRLAVRLRQTVADSGTSLRALLAAASALAALLLALMLRYAWRSRRAGAAAVLAERQVADILATVREGLFLIDRDLRLGAVCSDSLAGLLRAPRPTGQSFESLLAPLVDEKTCAAALKYVGLLWKERVHEELIESVNPLGQIEVSFEGARGPEVRYLSFSFRRVRAAGRAGDAVLGSVADITDRVLMARELEQVKGEGESQVMLVLQLLQSDGPEVQTFLANADTALRKSNAMLTVPGITQEELRAKLQGVFRELHTLKGEASALGLRGLVEHIHAIEDTLEALRARSALAGNDFLPVVVQLDELMSYLAQVQTVRERVVAARPVTAPARSVRREAARSGGGTGTSRLPTIAESQAPEIAERLRQLVQEVSREHACSVRLITEGLEQVPASFAGVVRDICIHMVGNAIVHGIEPAPVRLEQGKAESGTVRVTFSSDSAEHFMLIVEDDGRGLSRKRILERALQLNMITPRQIASLDRASVYRLIFQPGFSTAGKLSEHAGRGVGLDAVGALLRERSGQVGVFTVAGQFTRFKVLLPKALPSSATAPSAA